MILTFIQKVIFIHRRIWKWTFFNSDFTWRRRTVPVWNEHDGRFLKNLAGGSLERILEKLTTGKSQATGAIKGFGLGTGVTAIIQSSAATTIMLIGFVNAGIMKLGQAILLYLVPMSVVPQPRRFYVLVILAKICLSSNY